MAKSGHSRQSGDASRPLTDHESYAYPFMAPILDHPPRDVASSVVANVIDLTSDIKQRGGKRPGPNATSLAHF